MIGQQHLQNNMLMARNQRLIFGWRYWCVVAAALSLGPSPSVSLVRDRSIYSKCTDGIGTVTVFRYIWQQECIPVGCVPSALYHTEGLCPGNLCPRGSLSRGVSVQQVSVQGCLCPAGLCPGSLCQGYLRKEHGTRDRDREPLEGACYQEARNHTETPPNFVCRR